jgi:hypothetical protein
MIFFFVVKLVYTKVVDKLGIYLLLRFGGIWPCGLGFTAVQSWSQLCLLCLAQTSLCV